MNVIAEGKAEEQIVPHEPRSSAPSPKICPEYVLCKSFKAPGQASKECGFYDTGIGECSKFNRRFGVRRSIRAHITVSGEQSTRQLSVKFDLPSPEVKRLLDRDVRLKLLSSYNRESDNILMWNLHNGDRIFRTTQLKKSKMEK